MNLVIDAFNEPFDWSALASYTFLEWIAFILLVIGIGLSFGLVLNRLYLFVKGLVDKKKREQ
ncbi:MAG: hypothetical protein ABS948_08465 [Solibacillus sp.]